MKAAKLVTEPLHPYYIVNQLVFLGKNQSSILYEFSDFMFSESFVYFECPVKSNHRGTVEVFEWHPLHPIIAVSLSKATENNEVTSDCGGVVNVFDQSVSLDHFGLVKNVSEGIQ